MEGYFQIDFHRHRVAIFHGWLEAPFFCGFNGLFIQSHAERTDHMDVPRKTVGSYNQTQHTDALIFRLACFFRELRLGLVNGAWW